MGNDPTGPAYSGRQLRLWPGVVAVVLQFLLRFGLLIVLPGAIAPAFIGGAAAGLLVVAWWLLLSRAPWVERLSAVALMVIGLVAASRVLHESLALAGQGVLFPIYAIPGICLALVVWAVATRSLADGPRRATMVAAILLSCGAWALVRTEGLNGDARSDLAWRWSPTSEERLLAGAREEPTGLAPAPTADTGPYWPGFRGPRRDSIVPDVRIETDWSSSPPAELWRRAVGPGWSSFAVRGDVLYTQEQRGDREIVAAYRVSTGVPVWRHSDAARFWESNAGAGPRATPTLAGGRLYTFGATGILNVLDAATGALVWTRDVASDTGVPVPEWGFASSPLLVDDLVLVAAAGRLAAYDRETGEPRWYGPDGRDGYSSPQLLTIAGVAQIVHVAGTGVSGMAPADGAVLWEHSWRGSPIVQPALTADGGLLLSTNGGGGGSIGTRRLGLAHGADGWKVQERWTSIRLKPYFNDFVIHAGHAYGFDGSILACIDVEGGDRQWKGGRYGHGQLILLADQDLLLVLSEEGELVLVAATPEEHTELARFPAIEGKTWNHPVLVGDVLLVRNGEEMAAFRLTLAGG